VAGTWNSKFAGESIRQLSLLSESDSESESVTVPQCRGLPVDADVQAFFIDTNQSFLRRLACNLQ
jgi:hypothetical protein